MKLELPIFILALLMVSCVPLQNPILEQHPIGSILFPKATTQLKENQVISFHAESNGLNLIWVSDIQGLLGKGNQITSQLTKGNHKVSLVSKDSVLDTVDLVISPISISSSLVIPLYQNEGKIAIPSGSVRSYLVSTALQGQTYPLSWQSSSRGLSQSRDQLDTILPLRPAHKLRVIKSIQPRGSTPSARSLTDRDFYFPDIQGTGSGKEITFRKCYSDGNFELFIDLHDIPTLPDLTSFWHSLGQEILPRVETLWGPPDVAAGPKKTIILLTKEINLDGSAIGFFNPADLFPRNTDETSPSYNPHSNQDKILYCGLPESDSINYSQSSIIATAAHEYQHLIHFSRKTLKLAQLGNYSRFRETVFLDEGFSHLTENLVGLGVSGGNLLFVAYYLKNTQDFSLLFADKEGVEDNPGIRGAMSLFLYWLFENAGGGHWDPDNPTQFIDQGGLHLLRSMIDSPEIGVSNIEKTTGKPMDELFREWSLSLNQKSGSTSILLDPLTDEPNALDPFLGPITFESGKVIDFAGPNRIAPFTDISILPYSLAFYEEFNNSSEYLQAYYGSANIGPLLYYVETY